jgi:hypothetical protein
MLHVAPFSTSPFGNLGWIVQLVMAAYGLPQVVGSVSVKVIVIVIVSENDENDENDLRDVVKDIESLKEAPKEETPRSISGINPVLCIAWHELASISGMVCL